MIYRPMQGVKDLDLQPPDFGDQALCLVELTP